LPALIDRGRRLLTPQNPTHAMRMLTIAKLPSPPRRDAIETTKMSKRAREELPPRTTRLSRVA